MKSKNVRMGLFVLVAVAGLSVVLASCSGARESLTQISVFRWDLSVNQNDAISKEIASKFGLRFRAISAPWASWPEKLNAMVASGDLPDVFVGYGIMDGATYTRWARDGLLLPISDHLSGYPHLASYLSRFKDQAISTSASGAATGAKLYSIPVEDYVDHVMMIRGDWLKALNLSPPTTIEDLYRVAVAMRDRYGITPISSSPAHTSGFFWLNFLFYAYGSVWDGWVKQPDGTYVPSWIADGSRDAIVYIHRLYHNGLLDPDFPTLTDAQKEERFATGKAGIVMNGDLPGFRAALARASPHAQLLVFPPPAGPKGKGMWGLNGYFSAVMIKSGIEKTKLNRFLAFMDFLHSPAADQLFTYGVKGVDFRREGPGGKPASLHLSANGTPIPLLQSEPSSDLRYLAALEWRWMPSWDTTYKDETTAVDIGKRYSRPARFPYIVLPTQANRGQQLQDYVFSQYVKMVLSPAPVSSHWSAFGKGYLDLGGAKLIKEMKEWLAAK